MSRALPSETCRSIALDALSLCALKLVVSGWVLGQGFTHISDDDYARTVIAEQFAHAPRLDPSATSWLPLPFWIEGGVMTVAGRTLGVARTVAVVLGTASVCLPYLAMRWARVPRASAIIATVIAMALPYSAWLSVATVPEGWSGAMVAAAAIAMGSRGAEPLAAAALMGASLCRYEAWPACTVFATICLGRMQREARPWHHGACAFVALAGPLAWMAWNAHSHGSAVHFVSRVTAFRQAVGAADVPVRDKLFGYPWALARETPEAAILGLVGVIGMVQRETLRARWRTAATVAVAIGAFLVVGDLGDGAPTHHPARALSAVWWILVGMGVDAAMVLLNDLPKSKLRWGLAVAATLVVLGWSAFLPARWHDSPGRSESEQRGAQIARGLDLRWRNVPSVVITPCSFEHFALVAAWGEPERASVMGRTGEAPTQECPGVVEGGTGSEPK